MSAATVPSPLTGEIPRPGYLTPEDEVLHPLPGVPLWVENYLSQAYCPEAAVGFFLHIGRVSFDPELWEELALVYLPGDEFLAARSFGYGGESASGPSGPGLTYECVEPYRHWRKTFKGAATHLDGESLRAGAVRDSAHVKMEFELNYEAMGPVFELGEMKEQNWASWHYEQHCVVSGELSYGDRTIPLSGTGIRDHSTGTRDLTSLENHIWCHAEFPDGRAFCLMYLANQDGSGRMNHAAFCDGDTVRYGKLVSDAPLIDSWDDRANDYELVFEVEGETIEIAAELLQVGALTISGPGELVVGAGAPEAPNHHRLSEAMSRFRWDGEVGYGLSERTVKL